MDILKVKDDRSFDKVRELLNKVYGLHVTDYELSDLEGGGTTVTITTDKSMDARITISTDNGSYHGYLNCYPSIHEGRMETLEDIMMRIENEGVVLNLNEEKVKECFHRYADGEIVENELIAEGVEPTPGRDAEVIVQFGKKEHRPKMTSDGKIDYKNLDNIVMVSKGDVLITKRPASPGVRGVNIKNEAVVPIPGKDHVILVSDGATVNETGTVFTAMVDGYVDYNGRKLGVYSVYVVKKNVDYSVGNIKFNGSVHVCGDVLPGFKIEASKHILVDGICQDCELIAKGNVILKTGIKCNKFGYIKANGNVILGYAEKTKIYARENIEVKKYAFNCDLFAGDTIQSSSSESIIAGGTLRAFSLISTKQLGTTGNSKFNVIIGTKYYIEFELEALRREKQRISETLNKVTEALSKFDLSKEKIVSHPKIRKMLEANKALLGILKDIDQKEMDLIVGNKAKNPKIKVKGDVYEGVNIMFYNVATVVRERMEKVVFYFDEKYGEVAWVSLKDLKSIDTNDDEINDSSE